MTSIMEILLIPLLLGFIPAVIASNKGRSFMGWYIYGVLLFIVALIHSLVISKDVQFKEEQSLANGDTKRCEFCAEPIRLEAKVCRYCGRDC
jgi:hypothetical protein